MKPKVMIITPGTFFVRASDSSSVERVVTKTSEQLRERAEIYIFGRINRGEATYNIYEGVHYIGTARQSRKGYIREASKWINLIDPHIIQLENRPRLCLGLKKTHRSKQVWLSLHSTTFISKPHILPNELNRCMRSADRVLVNSRFLQEYILKRFSRMTPDRVRVNHLGVDNRQFVSKWTDEQRLLRDQFARAVGLEGKKVILYVGRLVKIKGIHHVLKLMPKLVRNHPDAVLVIVGGSSYGSNRVTPYVRGLYRMSKPIAKSVRFVPYVPYDQINNWFRLADIVVVPSAANEAFGLVNVEAMSTGVPVIATRAGGMTEIIEDGRTGFLVDSLDIQDELLEKIDLLLSDPELCRKMGENSVARVSEHFTWRQSAERLLDMYRTISEQ